MKKQLKLLKKVSATAGGHWNLLENSQIPISNGPHLFWKFYTVISIMSYQLSASEEKY